MRLAGSKTAAAAGQAAPPDRESGSGRKAPPGDGPPPPISKRTVFSAVSLIVIVIAAFVLWPKPPDPALGRTKVVFLGEAGYDLQEIMQAAAEEFNSSNEELFSIYSFYRRGGI